MAYPNTNPTYHYLDGAQEDGTVLGNSSYPVYIGNASNAAVYVGVAGGAQVTVGQTSASLIGFWGATPSARVAFTAAAVATTAAISSGAVHGFTSAQANGIISLLNEVRAAMVSMGMKA